MPTVKLNKKTVLELLGRKISDEVLADRISMLGTGLESIGETEIEVEVFPNRPDLLSEQGMARALSSFMGIKTGFRHYFVKKGSTKVIIDKSVKNIRPFTACAVVKNIKLTEDKIKEIIQIQEKLHITYGRNRKKVALGIYPLEHIKPPIYYKALVPEEIKFKPLDLNKELTGNQILAIHPTGREYGHLLEDKEKFPVFLDSKMKVMSMPPIINSNDIGKISLTTKDVFIECSGFDFDYLHTCLNMVVTALADMGGSIESVDLSYPDKKYTTPQLAGKEIKIEVDYINKILGLELKEVDMKKLLEKMGYDYKNKKALIPGYRADILHPIDLVEDIAIAFGYENFHGTIANVACSGAEKPFETFKNKIRDVLIGSGLIEIKNYHITNKINQSKLMNHPVELVELANSLTQDYDVLRAWIIPNLLETLRYNKMYEYPQNIFEIGTVFKHNDDYETGIHENDRLGVALCGQDANFTKIKQIFDVLMSALNMKYETTDTEHNSFIKGRIGRIVAGNEKIAYLGEIHPQVLANWSLEMPVAVFELNLSDLFRIMHFPSEISVEIKHEKIEKHIEHVIQHKHTEHKQLKKHKAIHKPAEKSKKHSKSSSAKKQKPVKKSKQKPVKKTKSKPVKHKSSKKKKR